MSRSLSAGPQAPGLDQLVGVVDVYDPAMCCPTGVCGPGVDPALLQIARDLRWLAARGVVVTRHGLAQEPDAFASAARVGELMKALGNAALPMTFVNGDVLVHGRYPSRDELTNALTGRDAAPSVNEAGACCAPNSGCC